MAWVLRDIKDQVVQYPNRYKINGVSSTIEPDFGTITENGTSLNRAYLMPIENELYTLSPLIDRVATLEYDYYGLKLQSYYDSKTPLSKGLVIDGFLSDNNPSDLNITSLGMLEPLTESRRGICNAGNVLPDNSVKDLPDSSLGTWRFGSISESKAGMTFWNIRANTLNSVTVKLQKYGNPTDNITCSIYSTNSSGYINANGLIATSTNSIAGSNLTTSFSNYTFNFTGISLSADTIYAIILSRTGATSNSDYYNWAWSENTYGDSRSSNPPRIYGIASQYTGSSFVENSNNYNINLVFSIGFSNISLTAVYQTLEQLPSLGFSNIVMYVSAIIDGTNSITPNIDAYTSTPTGNFTALIKDTTYARDVGGGYTEYKYALTLSDTKSKAKIKIDFNYNGGTNKLREYGVLLLA